MRVELIGVGTELLRGRRDSNGDWIARHLLDLGVAVALRIQVGDALDDLVPALVAATARGAALIVTGGLGPTEDDRTREAIAAAWGVGLERDVQRVALLQRRFVEREFPFHERQARQGDRPQGARWIDNPLGSAPGFLLEDSDRFVVALPGVPAEMRAMFRGAVAARVANRAGAPIAARTLKIGGRPELAVDRQLGDLYRAHGVEVTVLSGPGGLELQLVAAGDTRDAARARVEAVADAMRQRLGVDLYGENETTLASVVGELLAARGATVATAESCTGGLLGAALTGTPGASRWFRGGLIVYDDRLKRELAGVPAGALTAHGAVSEAVARALADGARTRCAATHGLGVTGIAGPCGGTEAKPVGLVHLALAHPTGMWHRRLLLPGDREAVRRRAVAAALDALRRHLVETVPG